MKSHQKNLLIYLRFISSYYSIDLDSNYDYENRVLNHIYKLDIFILYIINTYVFILSFLSRIIFFKPFMHLKDSQINFLRKFLIIFNFLIKKIDQVFFTIINLHTYGEEKLQELLLKGINNGNKIKNHYKYIVIGSGPSGAVTASELSKISKGDVLIIEKGGFFNIPLSKHPGDEFLKKWYRGGVNTSYFREMIAYSSGSCFGGGSEINSGLYHKPDNAFLLKWADEYGTIGLDEKSVNKYSEKVEKLTSSGNNHEDKFSVLLRRGAKEDSKEYSKLKKFADLGKNIKNSMSNTLLKIFLNNGGNVVLNSHAKSIIYKEKKWLIKTERNNKIEYFSCDYLFICSGSIFTNSLLLNSGIAKEKKKIISTFKFHPMIKMIGSYKENVQDMNEDVSSMQNMQYWPSFIIGNASSSIQFLLSSFQNNSLIKQFIKNNWRKMTVFHATFSLGSGKILNLPFSKEPILMYFLSPADKRKIHKASIKLFEFIKNTGSKFIIPILSKDQELIQTDTCKADENLFKNTKEFQISSVHILGGVTMGEKPECVTNSYGKMNGYDRLYVNDSSLINTKLLKNPQGTIMMIAYRNINNFIECL